MRLKIRSLDGTVVKYEKLPDITLPVETITLDGVSYPVLKQGIVSTEMYQVWIDKQVNQPTAKKGWKDVGIFRLFRR